MVAFVRASVPDDGRVDDVVQEVFVSALRNLHTLDSPEAFAPWLHRIARNACIDHLRRVSREEVSIDSYLLDGAEVRPMRLPAPSIHGHVARKEDLDHLRQAFGELPESQHQALVLRELEGLSYDEIGRRLRMSRPAVESILFRARRGLKGEFAEISTGARCVRVRAAIAGWAEGVGSGRERRVAMRHLRTCQGCRREAAAMGLHGVAHEAAQAGAIRRAVDRAAAFIPLPVLFARRSAQATSEATASGTGLSAQAQNAVTQVTAAGHVSADQAASLAQKAVAVVAAVAVVGGGGIAVKRGALPVSIPKITHSGERSDSASQVRPDGLPADPQKAAEVLFGGHGRGPVAKDARPPLVVPQAMAPVLPQAPGAAGVLAPSGSGVSGPPALPPTADGQSGSTADGGAATDNSGTSTDTTSTGTSAPVTTAPVTVPNGNGNGNGNANGNGNGNGKGKAKGLAKKQAALTAPGPSSDSGAPLTDPVVTTDPASAPDVPATGTVSEPATGTTLSEQQLESLEAGNSGKVPQGRLKHLRGG
jgi:RNA polymerase sigma factor (sigma-70 family)